jgi:GNAT superfamily N-acetyltransferase
MPRAASTDPNRLVRQAAGAYRSADDRFEVRQAGTGWFVVDTQQRNELGQELVRGPVATLAAVRELLPEARRTTLTPLPPLRPLRRSSAPSTTSRRQQPKAPPPHQLEKLLRDAAQDRFPPGDLAVDILGSPPGPSDAVVAFSSHSVIAAAVDPDEARAHLPGDDPGGPLSAPFLTWLGLQLGTPPGSLDIVLVADGGGVPSLERTDDADGHERVARARRYRSDVTAWTDSDHRGLVTIGRGLTGRWEVSLEVGPRWRGRGLGVSLARAALGCVPEGEVLFAQVAPGNVASVRAFLRAGYRPIGSEVLFLRREG